MNHSDDDERPERKRERPKRGPKPKRCTVCRANLDQDGYGEYIHVETGFYGEYDKTGEMSHVATAR